MRKSLQSIGGQAPEDGLNAGSLQAAAAGAAISLYAAWNARRLVMAWLHSPFDRCGSPAFLLWVAPVVFLWVRRISKDGPMRLSPAAFAAGLVISFAGVATDLSVLEYAGLAVALAGFLPMQGATIPWLLCAVAWMPAAGWAFSGHGLVLVNAMRVAVGLAAVLLTPLFLRNETID